MLHLSCRMFIDHDAAADEANLVVKELGYILWDHIIQYVSFLLMVFAPMDD